MSFIIGLILLVLVVKGLLTVTSFTIKLLLGLLGIVSLVLIIPAIFAIMIPIILLGCGLAVVGLVAKAIF